MLPFNEVDTKNQLFRQKWHYLRWLNSEASLRRYTLLMHIGLPLVIILWWFVERINLNFGDVPLDFAYRLIDLMLAAVFIMMVLSSYFSLPRIMGLFQKQFNSAYWDTLRLTPQLNSAILMSHDAVAQIRLWPLTALEIGLRIAIVALYILNNLYEFLHPHPQQSIFIWQLFLNPAFWGLSGIICFVGFIFILEPVIRVRLIIAFHITIATRIRSVPLALLIGAVVLALIHLVQLILILSMYALYQAFTNQTMGPAGIALCFVPLTGLFVVLLWAFYGWLRRATLNLAYNSAFRQD